MDVILSTGNASCVVKCPWESPTERTQKYARLSLAERTKKRKLGKSNRKGSHCVVQASTWSSSAPSSGFTSKAFQKDRVSECVIFESKGPGRFIGINSALDNILYGDYTWVLVAFSSKNAKHAIALLRFEKEGISLKRTILCPGSPYEGIVLRGPHVLYSTSEQVLLEGHDGQIALDETFRSCAQRYQICSTEHDAEAVVAITGSAKGGTRPVTLWTVRCSGASESKGTIKDAVSGDVTASAVSLRRGMFAAAGHDGSLRCFDIASGGLLWKAMPRKGLESSRCLLFYQGNLLAIANGSDVWSFPTATTSDPNGSMRTATLLFSDTCAAGIESHGHFFAPWRNSLLQLSDKNGTYCSDKVFCPAQAGNVSYHQEGVPVMRAVSRNLERRLDIGVTRVTDAAERQEEKSGILNHVRSLLGQAAGEKTRLAVPRVFHGLLENVIAFNGVQESLPDEDHSEQDSLSEQHAPSKRVFVTTSEPTTSSPLVKLLESVTGVDKSGQFVLIQARIALSDDVETEDDSESFALSLRLNIHFDRCVSAIWDVEETIELRRGDTTWLSACSPLSAIVANNASSLESLRVIVRVTSDNGRSQLLGSFSVSSVLSSTVEPEQRAEAGTRDGKLNFERRVYAIAEGPSAHRLRQRLLKSALGDSFEVKTREKLACVSFKVSSNVELALAIARLRASIDDQVSLRSSAKLSALSLRATDLCLRILEAEMQTVRDIVEQRASVGYDGGQILELLKLQVRVDELFGCLEEQFVGT